MSLIARPTETGYYATAFRVLEVLLLLPGILVGTMLPILARAARDDRSRHRYALERLFDATVIIGGWITVMVVLGAPFAMQVLTGDASSPSVTVLQIQSVALGASFVGASWQYGLLSLGRYRTLLISSFVPLAVSATLTLTLVPGLGAEGGALAVTAGEAVLLALGYLFIRRRTPAAVRPRGARQGRADRRRVPGAPARARASRAWPGPPSAAGLRGGPGGPAGGPGRDRTGLRARTARAAQLVT